MTTSSVAVSHLVVVPVAPASPVPAVREVDTASPFAEVLTGAPSAVRSTRRQRTLRRLTAGPDVLSVLLDSTALLSVVLLLNVPGGAGAAVLVVSCVAAVGGYRHRLTLSVLSTAPRLCCAASVGAVLGGVFLGHVADAVDLSVAAVGASAAVLAARFVSFAMQRNLRRRGTFRRRTVVVGGGPVAVSLVERMRAERESGLDPVLIVDDDPDATKALSTDLPVRSMDGDLPNVLRALRVDTAVIGPSHARDAKLLDIVRSCDALECQVLVVPALWQSWALIGDMDRIGAVPVYPLRGPLTRKFSWRIKLLLERTAAAFALIALSPLMAVIAVVVYRSDRSAPVLFRQTRVGLDGREFELLKFRSMKPADDTESQTMWSIADDLRVGPFGRFLRATSLDELPQLWNIVRGEMVLVGPRPERPHFVREFATRIPGYEQRHRVPVGLTGWAAINGLRGDTSIVERVHYDNFYIANWSLWLDFSIVFRTAWAVLARRGV